MKSGVLHKKEFLSLFLVLVLLSAGGVLAFEYGIESRDYLYWFIPIPIVFALFGYILMRAINHFSLAEREKHLVNVYLLAKGLKLFVLAAVVVLSFLLLEHIEVKHFLPVFIAFYVCHLVWETGYLFRSEKRLKAGKNHE